MVKAYVEYELLDIKFVPESWDLIEIGNLFDFKNGLNKSKEYFGIGTPIVNYMDVYKNKGLRLEQIEGKVSINKDELRAYNVKRGDVFFTRTSETPKEVGLTSVILDEANKTVFSGFILRGRPKDETLTNQYKKYCFSTEDVRQQIISNATFTTRALTNGKVLSKVRILVPPREEQQKIAVALSDMDELIDALEKIINKKKKIKQGTMQQLLTENQKMPGFKENWKLAKVEEFGTIITGGTPVTNVEDYWNGNVPWVTPSDISSIKDIKTTEREISEKGLDTINILPPDTVLVTCIASIGKNDILSQRGSCNKQINAIIPKESFNPDFIYY